jgi:hypothetical protein
MDLPKNAQGDRMRPEGERLSEEDKRGREGCGAASTRSVSSVSWKVVDTRSVKPVFIEKMFGPVFYYLKKAIEHEVMDFEKKTGKRLNNDNESKDKS